MPNVFLFIFNFEKHAYRSELFSFLSLFFWDSENVEYFKSDNVEYLFSKNWVEHFCLLVLFVLQDFLLCHDDIPRHFPFPPCRFHSHGRVQTWLKTQIYTSAGSRGRWVSRTWRTCLLAMDTSSIQECWWIKLQVMDMWQKRDQSEPFSPDTPHISSCWLPRSVTGRCLHPVW